MVTPPQPSGWLQSEGGAAETVMSREEGFISAVAPPTPGFISVEDTKVCVVIF